MRTSLYRLCSCRKRDAVEFRDWHSFTVDLWWYHQINILTWQTWRFGQTKYFAVKAAIETVDGTAIPTAQVSTIDSWFRLENSVLHIPTLRAYHNKQNFLLVIDSSLVHSHAAIGKQRLLMRQETNSERLFSCYWPWQVLTWLCLFELHATFFASDSSPKEFNTRHMQQIVWHVT
jgi:hypothetical protein